MGRMLLIVVDSHSKWIEVHVTTSATATTTIEKLRTTFATHGLPEVLVSDNGPAFVSTEFEEFLQHNGIKHLTSAPYHPASNGLAERAVQTVKEALKKMTGPLEVRVQRFLFKYRVTPQATTGVSPAELLMGRRIRTHLDLLYPDIQQRVRTNKSARKRITMHMLDHATCSVEIWCMLVILVLDQNGCQESYRKQWDKCHSKCDWMTVDPSIVTLTTFECELVILRWRLSPLWMKIP